MTKTIEKIETKFEGFFDWLNADGDAVLKSAVVFGMLFGLIALGSLCN